MAASMSDLTALTRLAVLATITAMTVLFTAALVGWGWNVSWPARCYRTRTDRAAACEGERHVVSFGEECEDLGLMNFNGDSVHDWLSSGTQVSLSIL